MPPFAQRKNGADGIVYAVIRRLERSRAPEMADTVDAPCHVLHQADAHQSTPDRAGNEAVPRALPQAHQHPRRNDAQNHPEKVELVDQEHGGIARQVNDRVARIRWIALEQPSHVRVPHPGK